ncbi:MAG: DUF423 domain-containing protein [Fuerstiella sp.]|nr:DUF423 domain-containing protein [Fuerstiella sp.]
MSSRICLILAAVFGFLAVLCGAFGAHFLSDTGYLEHKYADMDPRQVSGTQLTAAYKYYQDFQTGVRYHMWHALALMAVGVWKHQRESRALSIAAWSFSVGITLFSGALYLLVIGGPRFGGIPWGAVAPLGGTALMAGWTAVLFAAVRQPRNTRTRE